MVNLYGPWERRRLACPRQGFGTAKPLPYNPNPYFTIRVPHAHEMHNELPENAFLPIGLSNSGVLLQLRVPRMEGSIGAGILPPTTHRPPSTLPLSGL